MKETWPPAGVHKGEWFRVKVFGELRFTVYSLELIGTILATVFWSLTGPWLCDVRQPLKFTNIVLSWSIYPKNLTTLLTAILWWDSQHTIKKSPRTIKIVRFVCVLIMTITAVSDVITKAMPSTNAINYSIGSLIIIINQAVPGFYMLGSAMRGVQDAEGARIRQRPQQVLREADAPLHPLDPRQRLVPRHVPPLGRRLLVFVAHAVHALLRDYQRRVLHRLLLVHSARLRRPVHPGEEGGSWRLVRLLFVVVLLLLVLVLVLLLVVVVVHD